MNHYKSYLIKINNPNGIAPVVQLAQELSFGIIMCITTIHPIPLCLLSDVNKATPVGQQDL